VKERKEWEYRMEVLKSRGTILLLKAVINERNIAFITES